MVTDIVMTTRNRPDYLRRACERILKATKSAYALHVIDDGSTDPFTTDYLLDLWSAGYVASVTLRRDRAGIMANKNLSTWLALSDPFVITADDILCPNLNPDWLQRGLAVMVEHPEIGELDLNHPGAYRVTLETLDDVVYCEVVGGTFGFIRRAALTALPHYRDNFGQGDDVARSHAMRRAGYKVAFLHDVYCYHFGENSEATGTRYGNGPFIQVKNWDTLEPVSEP